MERAATLVELGTARASIADRRFSGYWRHQSKIAGNNATPAALVPFYLGEARRAE